MLVLRLRRGDLMLVLRVLRVLLLLLLLRVVRRVLLLLRGVVRMRRRRRPGLGRRRLVRRIRPADRLLPRRRVVLPPRLRVRRLRRGLMPVVLVPRASVRLLRGRVRGDHAGRAPGAPRGVIAAGKNRALLRSSGAVTSHRRGLNRQSGHVGLSRVYLPTSSSSSSKTG